MSKNVSMMEKKVSQSFSGVKKIQTNLVDDKTQYWVPEDEAYLYIKTKKLSVSKNGVYAIADENDEESSIKYDAYSQIKVKVPDEKYKTKSKKITKNGNYQALSDGVDAYSSVTVKVTDVSGGGDYTYTWQKVSNEGYGTPSSIIGVVECNGLIYCINSSGVLKAFNGTSWSTLASSFPEAVSNITFVSYNNQLHAISYYDYNHYVWNGTAWQLLPIQNPSRFSINKIAVEYQGKLHVLSNKDSTHAEYAVFDGTSWSLKTITKPDNVLNTTSYGYVYNDTIHCVSGGRDFTFSGEEFEKNVTWRTHIRSVGYSVAKDVERAFAVCRGFYSRNYIYSTDGAITRPEEMVDFSIGLQYTIDGDISSINKILYCIGKNSVYRATPVQ